MISQKTNFHCLNLWVSLLGGLNLEKMQGLSPGTKKTLCNNEMPIIGGCP